MVTIKVKEDLYVNHLETEYKNIRDRLAPRINEMRIKKFVKSEFLYNKYLTELQKVIDECESFDKRSFMNQHKKEVQHQMVNLQRVYSENLLSMKTDEINELDRVGLAKYSRDYQIVYSIESYLAEIIGSQFFCDAEDIKPLIEQNFLKMGLTYEAGSKAIITNNQSMIEGLTFAWILNVHPNINYKLSMLLNNLKHDVFEDIFGDEINLNSTSRDSEIRFGIMIAILINKYADSITMSLLDKLIPHFKEHYDKETIFTSKGIGSIVINSHVPINPDDITAQIKIDGGLLTVKPTVTERAGYFKCMK